MKYRILSSVVPRFLTIITACLRATAHTAKGLRKTGAALLIPVRQIGRLGIPGVLFVYCTARKLRSSAIAFYNHCCKNAQGAISHRYVAHALMTILVLFAAIPSLHAASDAPAGTFGKYMLLNEVISVDELGKQGSGGIIEDDIIPTEGLEYYLEARFQNEQAPAEDAIIPLPLALEGTAAIKLELPGTTIPLTRRAIAEYTVQPGDTPWSIAEQFGVSVATVLWENNLSLWSTIRPAQMLKILPVSGVSHKVQKGDTIAQVAKRYSASADEIRAINSLPDGGSLAVSSILVIPGGRPFSPPRSAPVVRREVVNPPPQVAVQPSGQMLWPVPNSRRITQYFRWRHAGMDIGDKSGNPIVAADHGVVEYSGWGAGGWGYTIVIDHGNGLKTRYAHVSKLLVESGEAIQKGQTLALVGSTGRSTGPHLHFGVYVNGQPVNPLEYLR